MKPIKIVYAIIIVVIFCMSGFLNFAVASDQSVYQIQQRLLELGYDPGPVDGVWGQKTKSALIEYQTTQKLSVTGEPDEPTRERLGVTEAPKPIKKQSGYTIRKGDSFRARGEFTCPKYCDGCISGGLRISAGTYVVLPQWRNFTCK